MQPYRLEMGTKLDTAGVKAFMSFGDEITDQLNEDLAAAGDDVLINSFARILW